MNQTSPIYMYEEVHMGEVHEKRYVTLISRYSLHPQKTVRLENFRYILLVVEDDHVTPN